MRTENITTGVADCVESSSSTTIISVLAAAWIAAAGMLVYLLVACNNLHGPRLVSFPRCSERERAEKGAPLCDNVMTRSSQHPTTKPRTS